MRVWCVYWLGNGSDASGRSDLDDHGGRLLGIAPEALSASAKGASNIRAYTMADIQTAQGQLDELAKFVKPKSLEKVISLIRKL